MRSAFFVLVAALVLACSLRGADAAAATFFNPDYPPLNPDYPPRTREPVTDIELTAVPQEIQSTLEELRSQDTTLSVDVPDFRLKPKIEQEIILIHNLKYNSGLQELQSTDTDATFASANEQIAAATALLKEAQEKQALAKEAQALADQMGRDVVLGVVFRQARRGGAEADL